jgi:hypothetical protein
MFPDKTMVSQAKFPFISNNTFYATKDLKTEQKMVASLRGKSPLRRGAK